MSILATHGHVVGAFVVVMVAPWLVWLACEMASYHEPEPTYTSEKTLGGFFPQGFQAPVVTSGSREPEVKPVELDVLAQVAQLLDEMELEV